MMCMKFCVQPTSMHMSFANAVACTRLYLQPWTRNKRNHNSSCPVLREDVLNWSEFDLHLLVACFLRVRFPIVIALNKAMTTIGCAQRDQKETWG